MHNDVLVQCDGEGEDAVRRLSPGERVCFSSVRGTVRLSEAGQVIGEIAAEGDHWRLSNLTGDATFVVENLEGGGEYVKAGPRRQAVCVPFELARLVIPLVTQFSVIKIFSAPPEEAAPAECVRANPGGGSWSGLDEEAKYFLVLVALCEPRLRASSVVTAPPMPALLDRLRPVPGFEDVSRAAVNYHIDYLVSTKLRPYLREFTALGGRSSGKRDALVDIAVKYDLVRPEHLMRLPNRSRALSA
ncbi:hypothetical protein JOF53_000330 [Crossiella equi]|uniref:Serine/threonine protein kinase n=1 Tax=Crossiella equi TaxID=130796 RepID=A0ABS5A4F9_9PSEU|nr:hypothetical protein [Crossiella equi]MBP2471458.1 hypothetical protein [Crossiella equi]